MSIRDLLLAGALAVATFAGLRAEKPAAPCCVPGAACCAAGAACCE